MGKNFDFNALHPGIRVAIGVLVCLLCGYAVGNIAAKVVDFIA